jgi:hypothetical protein
MLIASTSVVGFGLRSNTSVKREPSCARHLGYLMRRNWPALSAPPVSGTVQFNRNRRPNTAHFNFVVIANDATLGRPTIHQICSTNLRRFFHLPHAGSL